MQFPKELQLGNLDPEEPVLLIASMKCSSRRNCNVKATEDDDYVNPPQ